MAAGQRDVALGLADEVVDVLVTLHELRVAALGDDPLHHLAAVAALLVAALLARVAELTVQASLARLEAHVRLVLLHPTVKGQPESQKKIFQKLLAGVDNGAFC